jgi:streptogramin lyase
VGIGNEGIYSIDLVSFQTRFFKAPFWETKSEPTASRTVEDTDGSLWFCSPGGIALLERGAEQFSFSPLHRDGASKQLVRDLCLGQTGEIWLATRQGLFRFDTRKRQYDQQPTGGVRKRITRIGCDHEGLVWMSSWYNLQDGFMVFDPRLGKIIRTFSQNPNNPAMPANTDAWDIHVQRDRELRHARLLGQLRGRLGRTVRG